MQMRKIFLTRSSRIGLFGVLVGFLLDYIITSRRKYTNEPESIGAGGKGGATRTYAIDRDACIHFIRSSIATPSIKKFLLISALSIRRGRAAWFDDDSYALMQRVNTEIMPDYFKAKLAADEALTVLGEERNDFKYIILRPGQLTDGKEIGKIALGRTKARGQVTRADVADVAARLLEVEGAKGWFDLLDGDEPSEEAVQRVVKEGINSIDGEDIGVMKANLA
jgi:hypothetical protein